MQYTLRNIPAEVDHALREAANEQLKSLNQVAVEALEHATCAAAEKPVKRRDLTDIIGTWRADPQIEAALEDQRFAFPQIEIG